jgi:hypothetical protein
MVVQVEVDELDSSLVLGEMAEQKISAAELEMGEQQVRLMVENKKEAEADLVKQV